MLVVPAGPRQLAKGPSSPDRVLPGRCSLRHRLCRAPGAASAPDFSATKVLGTVRRPSGLLRNTCPAPQCAHPISEVRQHTQVYSLLAVVLGCCWVVAVNNTCKGEKRRTAPPSLYPVLSALVCICLLNHHHGLRHPYDNTLPAAGAHGPAAFQKRLSVSFLRIRPAHPGTMGK